MTSSVGAASTAMPDCGNRSFASALSSGSEYRVVLPSLPTGRFVVNIVFLHADVRARPYRVEDFRDAFAQLSLLPEVVALGAYRMNHVWAVTFKDDETLKQIVRAGELKVKSARRLVTDPANQEVRMKVHWLLHSVPDEDVRLAFAPFGQVTDVSRERWRVHGVSDKGSTTRLVTLRLNAGVKLEDLPHQVSVAGELALVVVPGRASLCLRCRGTGHIRRECRIPRCGSWRRFGHEEEQCARTYANVTGRVSSEDSSELFMDEADAEEASKAASKPATQESTLTPPQTDQPGTLPKVTAATGQLVVAPVDTTPVASMPRSASETPMDSSESVTQSSAEPMDVLSAATKSAAGKRTHNEAGCSAPQLDAGGGDEPPTKAPGMKRSTLKPRPNVPVDSRQAGKPPP
ncbi:uncharacterized protein LOC144104701 [Amblyomma americanum]